MCSECGDVGWCVVKYEETQLVNHELYIHYLTYQSLAVSLCASLNYAIPTGVQ